MTSLTDLMTIIDQGFKEDLTVKFSLKLNLTIIIKLQRYFDHPMTCLTKKKSINTFKIILFYHNFSLFISDLHFIQIFFLCYISQKKVEILVFKVSSFKFQTRLIKVCI